MTCSGIYGALGVVLLAAAASAQPPRIIDTRGPIKNVGMTVKVDRDGVEAPDYHFRPPADQVPWSAAWIAGPLSGAPAAAECVRKEIILLLPPKKVVVRIASDNYLLYLNGRLAARGPADPGRDFKGGLGDWRFYDCRDLTALFHQGTNVIAAELVGCNNWRFEARVEYLSGEIQTFKSDATWKGAPARYLGTADVPLELRPLLGGAPKPAAAVYDAAAEPLGWQLAGFNDAGWASCQTLPPPAYRLIRNELPPLMEVRYPYFDLEGAAGAVTVPKRALEPDHPIVVKGDGEFTVHFDKVMSGRAGIAVKGGAGATLYLQASETAARPGHVYQLRLRDGLQYFESRDYAALGVIHVVVRQVTTPIEIYDVTADFLSQPVEYRGSFTCSDPALNTLWKSGRWSTQICLITHHLDSPQHQEPISDYGDYLIEDLVNAYALGTHFDLARQDLRKWAWVMADAQYRTFHTSYILLWLQSLLNYYDYTGDRRLVTELAPNVHAAIAQFTTYLGENGLISEAPNYMFMDWVTVHDDAHPEIQFAAHHPPAVIGQGYMTALFYRALADGMRVAALTGDSAHAQQYEALRLRVRVAYQRELWNEARGQYRDGKPFATLVAPSQWLPADVRMESFSVQNNALAALYDLAPADRQAQLVETMLQNPHGEVTPYFEHFVFESLAHAGLFGRHGVARMQAYSVVPATQTVREMGPTQGDYSHGWIASPTYQMSSKILGVVPTSPGFATFAIRPTLCGLSFARGTVPTPHGDIAVNWRREKSRLVVGVTIPSGTRATLALPVGGAAHPQLTQNGPAPSESLTFKRVGAALELEVDSGRYEFAVNNLEPFKNEP